MTRDIIIIYIMNSKHLYTSTEWQNKEIF